MHSNPALCGRHAVVNRGFMTLLNLNFPQSAPAVPKSVADVLWDDD